MRELIAVVGVAVVAVLIGLAVFAFTNPSSKDGGISVPYSILSEGEYSSIDMSVNYVINSQEELSQLWRLVGEGGEPPAIDFSSQSVIAVFAGEQPTAGYAIRVAGVADGITRRVTINLAKPGVSCLLAETVTTPYQVVALPKTDLSLTHEDTESVVGCLN